MDKKIQNVDDLPNDWWQHPYAGIDFANYYQRLTLGLLIALRRDNGYGVEVLSGLKIVYKERVLWLTAGHTIDYLNQIIRQFNDQIKLMLWLDPAATSEASAFVLHHRDFERYSASSSGIDIGFGILSDFDAMHILNNQYSILMTDLKSDASNHINPEGYYLVGYPQELGQFSQEPFNATKVQNSYVHNLVCLPMERIIEVDDDWPIGFKNNDDAFFGQLVESREGWQGQPGSIVGMSGGPAFAIARHPSNKFIFELVGIQSRWLPKRRTVCVEPISQALKFIEETFAN